MEIQEEYYSINEICRNFKIVSAVIPYLSERIKTTNAIKLLANFSYICLEIKSYPRDTS